MVDEAVIDYDFQGALATIEAGQESRKPLYPKDNAISLFLDMGMLRHHDSNYAGSSQDLQEAERLISEAFTKSISGDLLSYIANDNTKEYAGEDFEDIYLNVFNALNYFSAGDLEGAMVEIRRLTLESGKLSQLNMKYENARQGFANGLMETLGAVGLSLNDALPEGTNVANFKDSALARYLAVLFYMGNGDADSARIEFERLQAAFASNEKIYYHPIPSAVADVQNIPPGQARLNVIGFSGLSPVKQEQKFYAPVPFFNNPELQMMELRLPVMVTRDNIIDRITVTVDGQGSFDLELIEDMEAVAKETYNARFADTFFKTFVRVLGKYISADIAATAAGQTQLGELARVASVYALREGLDATEKADIRMSRFFPAKAYVGSINLDPGTYDITVSYYAGGRVLTQDTYNVTVEARGLNLLQVANLR
jgi:hypothetical protein